jgi:hypothetical protein
VSVWYKGNICLAGGLPLWDNKRYLEAIVRWARQSAAAVASCVLSDGVRTRASIHDAVTGVLTEMRACLGGDRTRSQEVLLISGSTLGPAADCLVEAALME